MADSELIPICASAALVDGGAGVRFDVAWGGARQPAFALRHGGVVVAYLNRCAHAALELDWRDAQFLDDEGRWLICAAHGALYEPSSGACAGGPCAGRGGLTRLQVWERDGQVYWRRSAA